MVACGRWALFLAVLEMGCGALAFFAAPTATSTLTARAGTCRARVSRVSMQATATVETPEAAKSILISAAKERNQDPETVVEAIRLLEKESRKKKEAPEGAGTPKFDLLTTNGNWRLVLTTGDIKTAKALGVKVNYVPIKAVQVFNADYTITNGVFNPDYTITNGVFNPDFTFTNGVYVGSFPLLKFSGTFTWSEEKSRLEFTFDKVFVLGIPLPFSQGEAKVQPGFTFMDIDPEYVIARGAGGGLALWLRVDSV